jgi:hypothetical protein
VSVQVQPAMATSLPIDYDKRLMLFSGRANPELASRIADKLGVDLGPVTLKTFSNGEVYCRYDESIRGADVFIVQPTCANPELGLSANDALMELLLMIDAASSSTRSSPPSWAPSWPSSTRSVPPSRWPRSATSSAT